MMNLFQSRSAQILGRPARRQVARNLAVIFILLGTALNSACTLASPFDRLVAAAVEATEEPPKTAQPTFTSTPVYTPTPTVTPTPTLTPLPTATPTSTPTPTPPPTHTPTITPTGTPTPPPPPTNTPAPTDTPTPSWEFQLAELYQYPTQATILSIIVAVQDHNGNWIAGYRVVGTDPNGLVTKSEPSADHETGYSPADSAVVKTGNTKFEPQPVAVYITGTWTFHLETNDGRQVSADFVVNMDVENRQWYFFRFQPF